MRAVETRHAPGTRLAVHDHEHAAATLVLQGTMLERVRRSDFQLSSGQLFLKPAAMMHENAYGNRGARSFIVEFPELARPDQISGVGVVGGLAVIYALRVYAAYRSGSVMAGILAEELVAELTHPAHRTPASDRRWIARVRDRVHQQFAPPPSLADLAREHGVHPVHVARAFRRVYGCSIGEYTRRRQVEAAVRFLRLGHSPASAACSAGFYDQQHLGRVLRQLGRTTPARLAAALRDGTERRFGSS